MSNFTAEELAKKTHSHLNTYIKVADQKASILLTALFAFLGFFGSGAARIWIQASLEFKVTSGLTILAGLLGALFTGLVIYPRSSKGDEEGLMFWESITEQDRDDYVEKTTSLNKKQAFKELVSQNFNLAKVADGKYKWTRWALYATAAMVILSVMSACVYFAY